MRPSGRDLGELPFSRVKAQILAISITDDPFGTVAAIERLLGYFDSSECTHLRIAPEDIGEKEVGHFAFFRSEYQDRLWPIALAWLQNVPSTADTLGISPNLRFNTPLRPRTLGR